MVCQTSESTYSKHPRLLRVFQWKRFASLLHSKMTEAWKPIPTVPGYDASTLGRIRRKASNRILKLRETFGGYQVLNIKRKQYKVHRLVALAWIPNPDQKPTVNHKSCVRNSNEVSNLEWATYAEQNATANKRRRMQTGTRSNEQYTVDLDGEQWKEVGGSKHVSNKGRARNGLRLVKPSVDNGGYLVVFAKALHLLVAAAFVANPDNNPIVNHRDGNKQNPDASNLEWVTRSENAHHAIASGLRRDIKKVVMIDSSGNVNSVYKSASAAGQANGICQPSVVKCCQGLTQTCGPQRLRFRYYVNESIVQPEARVVVSTNPSRAKLRVNATDSKGVVIARYDSVTAAAKAHKVNPKTVKAHCDGVTKHCDRPVRFVFAM